MYFQLWWNAARIFDILTVSPKTLKALQAQGPAKLLKLQVLQVYCRSQGWVFPVQKPVFAVQNGIKWDKPVFPSFSRPKLGKTVQNLEKLFFEQQKVSQMWLLNWTWTGYSGGQFNKKLLAQNPNFVRIDFALILILIIYSGLTLLMSHQLCCHIVPGHVQSCDSTSMFYGRIKCKGFGLCTHKPFVKWFSDCSGHASFWLIQGYSRQNHFKWWNIWHKSYKWVFKLPWNETFSAKKVTVSQEHPFACAQLAFHMLPLQINTLLYFSLSPQPVFKCMMYEESGPGSSSGRTFGIGLTCPSIETFCVTQKSELFLSNIHLSVKNYCCCPLTVRNSKVNFIFFTSFLNLNELAKSETVWCIG